MNRYCLAVLPLVLALASPAAAFDLTDNAVGFDATIGSTHLYIRAK